MAKRKSKKQLKEETLKQVKVFFKKAALVSKKDIKLANNYIRKARRLAMKVNLTLPRALKRKFCKHCYDYLIPGNNSSVRFHKSRIVYYCFNCKEYTRFVKKINKK